MTNLFGKTYGTISADPPWNESGGGKCKRGADRHYPLIKKKEDIRDTMLNSGCWNPDESCHLHLWVTNNFLEDGLWLMKELGFRYVTKRTWAKMEEHGQTSDGKTLYVKQNHGLGQYFWSGEDEPLLFGVRGPYVKNDPKTRPGTLLLQEQLLCAPKTRQHSEKPEKAYKDIELVSEGPYLEMFARDPRLGWDVWGLEADGKRIFHEEGQRRAKWSR